MSSGLTLQGLVATIKSKVYGFFDHPVLVFATDPSGNVVNLGAGGGGFAVGGSGLPYGADEQALTNAVGGPGPTVIVYKKAGVTIKTRTLSYTGSGPTDVLTGTVDT